MEPIISFGHRMDGRRAMFAEAPYRTDRAVPHGSLQRPRGRLAAVSEVLSSDCIFCRIAARELPAEILHETERVVAFRDLDPKAPTHVLLIPKEHLASIAEVGEHHGDMLVDLAEAATHLARTEGLDGGWRLVTNVGPDAGQSVPHLHLHLLGGRRMTWPPG
jgi:histidine triad (HIT) family protein